MVIDNFYSGAQVGLVSNAVTLGLQNSALIPPAVNSDLHALSAHSSSSGPETLWRTIVSGLGWRRATPDPPSGQYRPSLLERWERGRFASQIRRVCQLDEEAVRLWRSGRRGDAADAYTKLARNIWSLSQNSGDDLWGRAEEAMIRGALIMAGREPDLFFDDGEVSRYAMPVLLGRRMIGKNRLVSHEGVFVISRELGMGGRATVWKVFGRDEVIKSFDDGAMKFSTEFPPSSLGKKQHNLKREIEGLEQLKGVGLAAVSVYEIGDIWYRREFAHGIVRRGVEIVLGLDEIPSVLEALKEYKEAILANGITGFDGNDDGNFVYDRDGGWMIIDY